MVPRFGMQVAYLLNVWLVSASCKPTKPKGSSRETKIGRTRYTYAGGRNQRGNARPSNRLSNLLRHLRGSAAFSRTDRMCRRQTDHLLIRGPAAAPKGPSW